MTLPEVYSNLQKSNELQALLKNTQNTVSNLENSWEEKSMELENFA